MMLIVAIILIIAIVYASSQASKLEKELIKFEFISKDYLYLMKTRQPPICRAVQLLSYIYKRADALNSL